MVDSISKNEKLRPIEIFERFARIIHLVRTTPDVDIKMIQKKCLPDLSIRTIQRYVLALIQAGYIKKYTPKKLKPNFYPTEKSKDMFGKLSNVCMGDTHA